VSPSKGKSDRSLGGCDLDQRSGRPADHHHILSACGDSVEQIHAELAALRALAERIDRRELEAGDLLLLSSMVSECLVEKLAEDGEAVGEETSGADGDEDEGSTTEWESKRGPFGGHAGRAEEPSDGSECP